MTEPPIGPLFISRELIEVEREMAHLQDRRSLVLTLIALWRELMADG